MSLVTHILEDMTNTSVSGLALNELSPDIRPQDDLFLHVNGAWIDRTEIPDDKARWGSFHQLAEQAEQHVRKIVEEKQEAGSEESKPGDLYRSFMDTDSINAAGIAPLQDALGRVDQIASVEDLLRTAGALEREGIGGFLGVFIEPDPGEPTRYVPFFVQSGLSLPDESYYRLDNFAEIRTAHRAHIERMLTLAEIPDASSSADRIVALESDIASHHWDNVRSRDAVATYNLKTWDEITEIVGLDLAPWRDELIAGTPDAFKEVVLYQPSFLEGLGQLLVAERLEEWKAWLRLQIVHALAPYLPEEFVNENFAFYGTQLTGVPVIRERWKRGVALAEGIFGELIGRIYVERHFPPAAKQQMDEIVHYLVQAYRQSIEQLEWMSPETRERALAKLDAFTPKVGYPVKWRDYSTLHLAEDLVSTIRLANEFEHARQLAKIGQPIDRDEWYMTPQTVNAYYNPLMNEIVFPAAILQYPFFDPNRDAAANYGGIGAVIGHEIGHGFDDQGSRFDGDGTLRDWWTEADREAFDARTANLIAQYDALTPCGLSEEHTVNGSLTIGENIGDLGGLGIALKAYRLSLGVDADGKPNPAPVVDGYTGIQRLFLSWGQIWQQKGRDAETIRLLTIDPHSPNEFRCNQIVRNVDAFYDAFGVTETDALWLPESERVTIW